MMRKRTTVIGGLLLFSMLLFGCGRRDDPRVAELQARVADLEMQIALLQKQAGQSPRGELLLAVPVALTDLPMHRRFRFHLRGTDAGRSRRARLGASPAHF